MGRVGEKVEEMGGNRKKWKIRKENVEKWKLLLNKKAGIFCFEDFGFFLLRKVEKRIRAVYFQRRHRARTILPL